jgi:Domain of unknown function (DUF4129)
MPASSSGASTAERPARPALSGSRHRLVAAGVVLPALVLAALAAGSYRPFGGQASGQRGVSTTFVDVLFTLALLLTVALLVGAIWLYRRAPKVPLKPGRDPSLLRSLITYLAMVSIAILIGRTLLASHVHTHPPEAADLAVGQQKPPKPHTSAQAAARRPHIVWPLVGGAGALMAAAVLAAYLVSRRRVSARTPEKARADLEAALDEAIDDLRREPDPRRAVVAAYARMEQALSVYGLPRRPSEAPYEYLARVGRELQAEEPAADLTALFEVAKFSEHAVNEPMRDSAIAALTAVRDEVRAAAATA